MVFLDDSIFERELVKTAIPEIQVPNLPEDPAEYVSLLAKLNLFESRLVTSEDRQRQDYYRTDEARAELQSKYVDFNSYLRELKMNAVILGFDSFTLPRISQLVQRSNQFNLTTIRYSEADLTAMASSKEIIPLCIRLSDRLGDNGIIAVVILRKLSQKIIIDSWIMSCRVLGRGVEDLTLNLIANEARLNGCTEIIGRYIPTNKNKMVEDLYSRIGFSRDTLNPEPGYWKMNLDKYEQRSTNIHIALKGTVHD